jgi:hypothetical protein
MIWECMLGTESFFVSGLQIDDVRQLLYVLLVEVYTTVGISVKSGVRPAHMYVRTVQCDEDGVLQGNVSIHTFFEGGTWGTWTSCDYTWLTHRQVDVWMFGGDVVIQRMPGIYVQLETLRLVVSLL